jgi:hypothetical protein
MLPTPATRRWSSSQLRIGTMDVRVSACSRSAVNASDSGSTPSSASRSRQPSASRRSRSPKRRASS